jgi:hypothetical protein
MGAGILPHAKEGALLTDRAEVGLKIRIGRDVAGHKINPFARLRYVLLLATAPILERRKP